MFYIIGSIVLSNETYVAHKLSRSSRYNIFKENTKNILRFLRFFQVSLIYVHVFGAVQNPFTQVGEQTAITNEKKLIYMIAIVFFLFSFTLEKNTDVLNTSILCTERYN